MKIGPVHRHLSWENPLQRELQREALLDNPEEINEIKHRDV